MALVKEDAGYLVADRRAPDLLMDQAMELVFNDSRLAVLSENILKLSRPHAAAQIAQMVLEL